MTWEPGHRARVLWVIPSVGHAGEEGRGKGLVKLVSSLITKTILKPPPPPYGHRDGDLLLRLRFQQVTALDYDRLRVMASQGSLRVAECGPSVK